MTKYVENGVLVNLVNLTPHAVNFITADGVQVDVPPEGVIARLEQKDVLSRWDWPHPGLQDRIRSSPEPARPTA